MAVSPAPPSTSWHSLAPPDWSSVGFAQHPRTTRAPPLGLLCHPVAKARPRLSIPRLSIPRLQLSAGKERTTLGWTEPVEHLPRQDPLQMAGGCAEPPAQACPGLGCARQGLGALAEPAEEPRPAPGVPREDRTPGIGQESGSGGPRRAGLQQSLLPLPWQSGSDLC